MDIDQIINSKLKQLEKDLEVIAVKELKPLVEKELKESILRNVYSRDDSESFYDRTGAFYDSVTGFTSKANNSIEVYAITDSEHTIPRHTSWINGDTIYKGMNIDKHLDTWLEFGHNSLVDYEGSLSFTDAQYRINKRAKLVVKKGLTKMNYRVKG